MRRGPFGSMADDIGGNAIPGPLTNRWGCVHVTHYSHGTGLPAPVHSVRIEDMRAVVQRVQQASVTVDGQVIGEIAQGLCALVGVTHDDTEMTAKRMADKIWNLRVMDDADGVMNRSVAESTGEVLVVSQFTLYGDTSGGRRPSYVKASRPEHAEPLIDAIVAELRGFGGTVATGRFRTEMQVELI